MPNKFEIDALDIEKTVLKELLKRSPQKVIFMKKSGELRAMTCTLDSKIIPTNPEDKELFESGDKKIISENLNVLRVYDLEKSAWRSISMDSILHISEV